MPSSVPLINAVAQNTVDFNNQTPTNAGGLSRYKIKNIGAPAGGYYFVLPSDLNSVLIFSGDVTLYVDSNSFVGIGDPPAGSEVFFYSSGVTSIGQIKVVAQGLILTAENGPFLQTSSDVGSLIYMGLNNSGTGVWAFASKNYNFESVYFINCCDAGEQFWQIAEPDAGYNSNLRAYVTASLSYPYNGVYNDNGTYTSIINGYAEGPVLCNDNYYPYDQSVTFYNSGGSPITLYGNSNGSYTASEYLTLLGAKFFTAIPNSGSPIYSCYSDSNAVGYSSPVQYFGSTAQIAANDPVTFYDGYVVNYAGIPT